MPGLFDPTTVNGGNGGILSGLSNFLLNLNPTSPQGQAIIGQRQGTATFNALRGQYGDQAAMLFTLHPELMDKLMSPEKVGPGEDLKSAIGIPGLSAGSQAPQQGAGLPSQPAPGGFPQMPGQGTGVTYAQNTNGLMDQTTAQNLAKRYVVGDKDVLNMGGMAGPMGQLNRKILQQAINTEMAQQNLRPEDVTARIARFPAYEDALKTNAQTGARMQMAQTEALGLLPLLKQAASATNPTNLPVWNAAKLQYMAQTGDPRSASLASYQNALINTYARGITTNPRGPTDSDKAHLRDVVNPYWSKGQWDAGAQAIQNELDVAHGAVGKNQNRINVNFGFGKDADPNDIVGAKAAVAKGAPKEQIIRRFEENGFNAPKF